MVPTCRATGVVLEPYPRPPHCLTGFGPARIDLCPKPLLRRLLLETCGHDPLRSRETAATYDARMEQRACRIGPLAKAVGISPDSIRHYERLGLLGPTTRTAAGYRLFSPAAVERLQLVRSAVQAGFALRQLAAFVTERDAGGVPCRKVRATAAEILARMDEQIADLQASRASLRAVLRDWDERLAHTPTNQPAHLLKSLPGARQSAPPPVRRIRRRA